MYGKNHHMYGIKDDEILNAQSECEGEDAMEKARKDQIRVRIKAIEESLEGPISSILRNSLKYEIDYLRALLPEDDSNKNAFTLHHVKQESAKDSKTINHATIMNAFRSIA